MTHSLTHLLTDRQHLKKDIDSLIIQRPSDQLDDRTVARLSQYLPDYFTGVQTYCLTHQLTRCITMFVQHTDRLRSYYVLHTSQSVSDHRQKLKQVVVTEVF